MVPPDVETRVWGLSLAAASLIRDVQPGHYNTLQYITTHYTLYPGYNGNVFEGAFLSQESSAHLLVF